MQGLKNEKKEGVEPFEIQLFLENYLLSESETLQSMNQSDQESNKSQCINVDSDECSAAYASLLPDIYFSINAIMEKKYEKNVSQWCASTSMLWLSKIRFLCDSMVNNVISNMVWNKIMELDALRWFIWYSNDT